MPIGPPDLGMGKAMAVAGSLLMAITMVRGLRAWWARRKRAKARAEQTPKNAKN